MFSESLRFVHCYFSLKRSAGLLELFVVKIVWPVLQLCFRHFPSMVRLCQPLSGDAGSCCVECLDGGDGLDAGPPDTPAVRDFQQHLKERGLGQFTNLLQKVAISSAESLVLMEEDEWHKTLSMLPAQ